MCRFMMFLMGVVLGFTWNMTPVGAESAGSVDFIYPLSCDLGTDCVIANYVDQEKGAGHADYECRNKTYNGHKGVDFAVRGRKAMLAGVDVIAARAGTVLRVRDGEDDTIKSAEGFEAIQDAGKECGNGVLLQHENGWQSFYCHLKQGSIVVKRGQRVSEGQKIAEVGQSGFSEFPHLHFSLIKNGLYVDPFTGLSHETGCNRLQESLWRDQGQMPYSPFAIFDRGFSVSKPDFKAVAVGDFDRLDEIPIAAEALVYWVGLYHARAGDEMNLAIYTPAGDVFHARRIVMDKSKKRPTYFYAGRKTRNFPLVAGRYKAELSISRKDEDGQVLYKNDYVDYLEVR